MRDVIRRLNAGRRSSKDRRSGVDTRSDAEKIDRRTTVEQGSLGGVGSTIKCRKAQVR
jgi:hypothetical protein